MPATALNRILMVEDDVDIQAVARLALESVGGFVVHICGTGRDALDACRQFAPDLILLDVMMPDMDGPTVLKNLRASSTVPETPIIFMTAKAQPHEITHFKRLGALDVIPKPFDPMMISETIRTIWKRAHSPEPA